MTKTTTICNMCGKEISEMDLTCNPFTIGHQFGYGSVNDGSILEIDLCSKCQDEATTYFVEKCKISPVTEREY